MDDQTRRASDTPVLTPGGPPDDESLHIVDVLIEERARHLVRMPIVWPMVRAVFYPLLRYREAKRTVDEVAPLSSHGVLDYLANRLALDLQIEGMEHVPSSGKAILVANHPTGIVDGIALYQALLPMRRDVMFFANRDAIRACPSLVGNIIPVEWVEDRRTRAKTKETLLLARKAFEQDRLVMIFPSGRLAHMTASGLKERPWLTTVLSLMRRHHAPILPIHISARNSLLYYTLHFLSNELRDMTIFNEMLNKQNKTYRITFGPMIQPDQLDGDPEDQITRLQHHVERSMGPGRAPPFP
ncbi:MAG: 1-acyl-sn-glycerol-3-phosphate acyltransferase [Alphaproteobacteria bacterium]